MQTSAAKKISISFFLFLLLIPLYGQKLHTMSTTSLIDWAEGALICTIEVDLEKKGTFIPSSRYRMELDVDTRLPLLVQEDLQFALVDSYNSVGTLMEMDPLLTQKLFDMAGHGRKTASHLSKEMDRFIVRYRFDLYPHIINPFVQHTQPYPVPKIIDYEPTTPFSGIVIYMQGVFPVHGEEKSEELRPCFFPKIFDQEMRLILESGMVSPEVFENRGMVAYTDTVDEKPFIDRIGYAPLRIIGTGIFGKYYTDIIIPIEAARKILYSEKNRRLLTEGKILIICNRARIELKPD